MLTGIITAVCAGVVALISFVVLVQFPKIIADPHHSAHESARKLHRAYSKEKIRQMGVAGLWISAFLTLASIAFFTNTVTGAPFFKMGLWLLGGMLVLAAAVYVFLAQNPALQIYFSRFFSFDDKKDHGIALVLGVLGILLIACATKI